MIFSSIHSHSEVTETIVLYFLILRNSADIHISSLGHLWYTEPAGGGDRDCGGRIDKFAKSMQKN